ncbi:MAG: restriction endonuclease, SacI family [Treponema sp.]|nr:restriction endonuclease, SacI family [Treponema sp.]
MTGATTTYDYPRGVTPEDVWAILRENAEQMRENAKQMEELREKQKETDLQMKETGRLMKETDRKIGALTNRFGELAEHLVVPNIKEKFNALGFSFEQVAQDIEITDRSGGFIAEVDILLENGDMVMAVEVKAKPLEKDVKAHVKRLDVLRRRADVRGDNRAFMGAIAGAIMRNEVRNHILRSGFYAIEQTGDTVKIHTPENFKPRKWEFTARASG